MIDLQSAPEQLAADIKRVAKDHRAEWIKDVSKNVRRLAGYTEQDVPTETVDPASNPVANVLPSSHRYATSFNVTRNFFYRLLGRIMPALTQFQVLAASRDRSDRDAAKIAGRYLRSRAAPDSGQDFEEIVRAVSYLFAGGPNYLRIEGFIPQGQEHGDVDTGAVMGSDVYYFPGITNLNESPAVVLEERMTQLVIERRYPKLVEQIMASGGWKALPGAEWPDDVDFELMSPKLNEGCYTVTRLLIRPTKSKVCDARYDSEGGVVNEASPAPNGREFIMIAGLNGKFEKRDDIGTADKMYPLEPILDIPMGPFYEDRGRMTISSRMQSVLDIAISKMLDVVVGGPQVIVGLPTGGTLSRDDFTNQAWCFYDKVPGQEPSIQDINGTTGPQNLIGLCMQFMGEVHAQSPASRGQAQGERQSGRAIEQLSASDVAVDEPFMAMMRRFLSRVGKRTLMEAKRVLGPNHPFVSQSKNQRFLMEEFNAADITGEYDVRVFAGRGLPDSKSLRWKMVIQGLGQIPLFSDAPEAIRARELLEMHIDDDEDYEYQDEEEQVIRFEDALILEAKEPPVTPADNHELHRIRHKQALNRARAATGTVDDKVLEVFTQHDGKHMAGMQAEMMAAQPPQPVQLPVAEPGVA